MAASVSSAWKPSTDRIPVNTTSFQKKTKNKLLSIPGTRLSVQNGQLLISTGVTSLDYLLGGGLAVGTVLLIEEDRYDSYSRMILKYFLAEGVICRHELFLGAVQDHPNDIFQELPDPILDDVAMHKPVDQSRLSCEPQDSMDAMKIAWRYQNLPKVQSALASSSRFGHYYDVSKTMESEIRQAAKCHHFYPPEHPSLTSATHSSMLGSYSALLKSIEDVICKEGYNVAATTSSSLMGSITRLCDNAIALESFKGSERETSPLYKDYHGLLHVRQVPYLNCLASQLPDHKDLAFKLKRKQFTIERLHLPPDLSETVSRVSRGEVAGAAVAASACGSGNKHLDF